MDSTVNWRMQSTEGMFVLDAIQRRLTELSETAMTPDTLEAATVEQALTILGRAEVALRDLLYPTEPLFPYLDDPTMTVARLDAEWTESELAYGWGK